jgi:hypothetical protein
MVAGPLASTKANCALLDDITANLCFLVSEPQANVPRSIGLLQSECPTVEALWGNLSFTVVRWRGDTNHFRRAASCTTGILRTGPLVAALECKHFSERDVVNDLADV